MFYQAIRIYCGLLVISLLTVTSAAGQGYYHKQYTYQNGLPTMGVYNVYCAPDGIIWMGSDIGLIQFDGFDFTTYTTENGLPDTEVISLLGDSQGRIWCLTFNGKVFYVKQNIVYNSSNSTLVAEINKRLSPIGFNLGLSGEVLIYAKDNMLEIIDNQITPIRFDNAKVYDLVGPVVKWNKKQYILGADGSSFSYFMFQKHELVKCSTDIPIPLDFWSVKSYGDQVIVSEGGVLSENGNRWLPIAFTTSRTNTNNVFVDKQNRQWYFNRNRGIQYHYNDSVYVLFNQSKVNSIDQDFEGNYWITTMTSGLFMLPHNFLEKRLIELGVKENMTLINAIELDNRNQLWAGNSFDNNFVINGTGQATSVSIGDQLVYSRIIDYAMVRDMIVVGADNKLVGIDPDSYGVIREFEGRSVKALSAKNDHEFAAAFAYGVATYSFDNLGWKKSIISETRAYAVQYDINGLLWYSTSSGLYNYDGVDVRKIDVPDLIDKRIVDIAFHPSYRQIIISTDGYGIYAISSDTHKVIWTMHVQEGLTSDNCRRMQVVQDTLWISTPQGLNCIRIFPNDSRLIQTIQESDGLPNNDIKDFIVDRNTLYVAGSFGILHWVNFLKPQHEISPKFVLYRLASEKGVFQSGHTVVTGYQDGNMSIDYALIAYAVSPPKLYYQLNEGKWQKAISNHIDVNNLDVGNHSLLLRYRDNDEWVYPVDAISIKVIAPFYQQPWFAPLFFVACLIGIAAYIIYVINLKRKKALNQLQLNEALTFAEQQSLQSMMNPHFIFNAINSVQQYIIRNDKKEANRYLTQFARLIRINLETSKQKYISLEEELERLNLYFQFEQVRFGDQLKFTMHCPDDLRLDKVQIPSMIIQPFVENAIWHGIMPKRAAGIVHISVEVSEENLIISVQDNGAGYKPNLASTTRSEKSSLGMHLTRRRLELLTNYTGKPHFFNIAATFDDNNVINGTLVKIHLPLELRAV